MSHSDRITRTDVAHQAGVSKAVVSAVLNNRARAGGIAEETIERVLDAIHELDYTPRAQAAAMATGRSDGLGIIGAGLPTLRDECIRAACTAGWYVATSQANDASDLVREHEQGRFDAFITLPGACIGSAKLPVVAIDQTIAWDVSVAADLAIEAIDSSECLLLVAQQAADHERALADALRQDRRCTCYPLALPTARPGEASRALERACSAEPALDAAAVIAIGDHCVWAAAGHWPQRLAAPDDHAVLLPVAVVTTVDLLQWIPGIPYPCADIARCAVAMCAHLRDPACTRPEPLVGAHLLVP